MKCTNCRADLEGGAKFCTLCGTPVPEGVVPEDPKSFDFGAILVATKAFFANVCGKIKPACAAGCGKIKTLAVKGDEKLGEKLGDKKMYVYAGFIGLIGILMVIAAIAGLIPNDNGYLGYDYAVELEANDDTVYLMKEGKAIALSTDAESVSNYTSSIDGKVTVFTSEGVLYAVKGKKTVELAEDVASYTLSLYGDYVLYTVMEDMSATLYHCKVSNGKSVEVFESDLESMLTSYAMSPDGKSVAYIATDLPDADLYYFNGKKSEKVSSCLGSVIGLSDGGKYIYATDINDEGKVSLHSFNKKGKDTKIDSCDAFSDFALNLDATEIMFMSNDKTYVSVKGKEPIKVASSDLELLTPAGVFDSHEISENSYFYPVETLFNHVYVSGNAAYFVSKKESKNIKLVKGSDFTLDSSAQYLYYMDKEDLMVLQISKGEKAEDKAKLIAEEAYFYIVTSDRKLVYYADEDRELYAVNGKKGGKSKKVSSDELLAPPVIDRNDVVYYNADESVYAVKGKKEKKVIDEAFCGDIGGYVYIIDEDNIYAARGQRKPKKLISID